MQNLQLVARNNPAGNNNGGSASAWNALNSFYESATQAGSSKVLKEHFNSLVSNQ